MWPCSNNEMSTSLSNLLKIERQHNKLPFNIMGRRKPTRCYTMFYWTCSLLNVFRAFLGPSLGARNFTAIMTCGVWFLVAGGRNVRCSTAGYASGWGMLFDCSRRAHKTTPSSLNTNRPEEVPDDTKRSRYITPNLQYSYINLKTNQPQYSTMTRLHARERRLSEHSKWQAGVHLMFRRQSAIRFLEHVQELK